MAESAAGLKSISNNNAQKEYYLTDVVGWSVKEKLTCIAFVAKDWQEVHGINSRLELAEANKMLRNRVVTRLALNDGVTVLDLILAGLHQR